jgi:uncharacterized protein
MRTSFLMPLLVVAALPPTSAGAQVLAGASTPLADGALLEVNATGRTARTPDVATIRAGVVSQAPTAAAALQDNARRMAAVLAAVKRAGVAARDVQTATIALQPQYRYADNQPPVVTGYQANNTVAIRFRDIATSGAILDALVREGANQIDGPTLSIDRPDAALDEARADAVVRARARAELYAKAAGLRVDRIVAITESGESAGPPAPPIAFVRAAAPMRADSKVEAGEQEVTASVTVRFLLK